ncbi:hypothetical protein DUNSADRAFT_11900 [Dunaliella salina]|uniref:Uncharacterized protein n=1 Tax=Dunaliella salina TaxID=3046 RepID=A0ABQ7H4B0_DUNSA|nr:hypothetical protein DUNSADRAFT_11900 [Dunaliella salina]|eukprot:KAF5841694.1 hypothetical protein DUNSADRAFT_11900 [Dunaliella salina]
MAQAGESETAINPYELERLVRIKRNQEKLEEIGVQQASDELKQAAKQRRRKEPGADILNVEGVKKAPKASRQSNRLRGKAADNLQGAESKVEEGDQPAPRQPLVKEVSIPIMAAAAEAALYQKNLYRVSTMSDVAMMRRITAITNISKMQSLVDVLQQLGSPLAIQQMAQEKLEQMTS